MAVLLKCPACREKFRYDVTDGWPDWCPICKTDINNRRDDDDVVMPNILSMRTKATDGVARGVMDGSEKRVELAAQAAGVDPSEMASLKITNLNDDKGSEWSTKDVVNPVTQQMDQIQRMGGQVGFGSGGSEYAAAAHAPPPGMTVPLLPNAGARAMNRLQRAMPAIGQAPLPLEITNNPNYRPRA
jgi:hypothetical protein